MKKLIVIISFISTCAFGQNLFVAAAASNDNIYKYAPDGTQSLFAHVLYAPIALAFDNNGNLFEAVAGGTIYKYAPDGTQSIFIFQGIYTPVSIACDSAGNLFVAARSGNIYKYTPNGTQSTFISQGVFTPVTIAFQPLPAPPGLQIVQLNNTQLVVSVSGVTDQTIVLRSSPDLQNWTTVATTTLTSSNWSYTNSTPQNANVQFYRATASWPL